MRNIRNICVFVCFVVWPSLVFAGLLPLGGEFQINTTWVGDQGSPSISTDNVGNFVATWSSTVSESCDSLDIFFQLFDSNGNKIGGETSGPEYLDEDQLGNNASMDADGDFVIVWYEGTDISIGPCPATNPDGDGAGIYAQRYFWDGTPNGTPFQVNTTWQHSQFGPVVAMNGPGDFVVVWYDSFNDGSGDGVFAQLFDSAGNKVGSEQLVNQTTAGDQRDFDVSINDDREWIVVWRSPDGDQEGVFARRFDSGGSPIEGEWRVNSDPTGRQINPAVVLFNNASFVIAWSVLVNSGDIYFQRFSSSGTRVGPETLAHPVVDGLQRAPKIGGNKHTNIFIITWIINDTDLFGSQGQLFSSNGAPDTFISLINTSEIEIQQVSSIAFSLSNKITIGWSDSGGNDGDGYGAFGQRYQATLYQPPIPIVSEPVLVLLGVVLIAVLVWAIRRRKIEVKAIS